MNVIESVVYCAAGLILLSAGISYNNYFTFRYLTVYFSLYLSLTLIMLPSLILLATVIAKMFCCIRGDQLINGARKLLHGVAGSPDEVLPEELPHRLERPLDYEPLN